MKERKYVNKDIHTVRKKLIELYWASEANPTLGCSIEISRDIYICVCLLWAKKRRRNTWAKRAHAQSQYWAVKSDQ